MNEKEKSGHDEDYVVFIPDSEMRAIERTIRNIEQVQQELRRIGDNENVTRLDNRETVRN